MLKTIWRIVLIGDKQSSPGMRCGGALKGQLNKAAYRRAATSCI
ncbi:hypothetical protein [Massilia rubra]|nr:hypothetical protein [Massilia rubra]